MLMLFIIKFDCNYFCLISASQQSHGSKSPQMMVNPEAFLDSSELDESDPLYGYELIFFSILLIVIMCRKVLCVCVCVCVCVCCVFECDIIFYIAE